MSEKTYKLQGGVSESLAQEYVRRLRAGAFERVHWPETEVEWLARAVYYKSHSEPFTGAIKEIEELMQEVIDVRPFLIDEALADMGAAIEVLDLKAMQNALTTLRRLTERGAGR